MISQKHRAIYIHIPRTAGTSIEKKLGLYEFVTRGAQDHRTVRDVRPISFFTHGRYLRQQIDGYSRRSLLQHMLGPRFQWGRHAKRATREQFDSYLKFTVVRNPWARVYSWYRTAMNDPVLGYRRCDFETFLQEQAANWALRPQLHWMTDFDGSIPLDRIIRFENLADEMAGLLAELGFRNRTLPHLNRGKGNPDYRAAYTDEAAELVARRYRDEIEMFGYRFEALAEVS
jgi:hypothetical protein